MGAVVRDPLVEVIIGAAINVHRVLGPGLLESAYQTCLAYEFSKRQLRYRREMPIPLHYEDVRLDCAYRVDFAVEPSVLVEIKSVERLLPIHDAQVMTYLRLTDARFLLLFNFNCLRLMDGFKCFIGKGSQLPVNRSPG
jgi:GxxExxY protein